MAEGTTCGLGGGLKFTRASSLQQRVNYLSPSFSFFGEIFGLCHSEQLVSVNGVVGSEIK